MPKISKVESLNGSPLEIVGTPEVPEIIFTQAKYQSGKGLEAAVAAPMSPKAKRKSVEIQPGMPAPIDGKGNTGSKKLEVIMATWVGDKPVVSLPGQEKPLPKEGLVERVYDGDTIVLQGGTRVRLQNVNTPELKPEEPYGKEAAEFLQELLKPGTKVKLVYNEERAKDHYGRIAAQVILEDGSDVAERIIAEGLGHVFIMSEEGNPGNLKALCVAQEKAKAEKKNMWSHERFSAELSVTSFHANGRGNDNEDLNSEYVRIANISNKPLSLENYTLSNKAGQIIKLPAAVLMPGHTVQVFSGQGTNVLDPQGTLRVFLSSLAPFWDNNDEVLTVKGPKDKIVATREHQAEKFVLADMRAEISPQYVGRLGNDLDIQYSGPKELKIEGQVVVDDGDTIFIKAPETGTFSITITDPASGEKVDRPITFSGRRGGGETPPGMLAVRFVGLDTPETHLEVKGEDGSKFVGQGRPGEIAGEALHAILSKATAIKVIPNKGRSFDVYGRLLGVVMAKIKGEWINVNQELVRGGMGEMNAVYSGDDFDEEAFKRLKAASKFAYENNLGIYAKKGESRCDERPVEFRRRNRATQSPMPFVIDYENNNNNKVYLAEDIDKVKPHNRLFVYPNKLDAACKALNLTRTWEAN